MPGYDKIPTYLNPEQRHALTQIPSDLSERDTARHYTFTEKERELINRQRRAANRLGFAVQLALLKFPGRTLMEVKDVPRPALFGSGQSPILLRGQEVRLLSSCPSLSAFPIPTRSLHRRELVNSANVRRLLAGNRGIVQQDAGEPAPRLGYQHGMVEIHHSRSYQPCPKRSIWSNPMLQSTRLPRTR